MQVKYLDLHSVDDVEEVIEQTKREEITLPWCVHCSLT